MTKLNPNQQGIENLTDINRVIHLLEKMIELLDQEQTHLKNMEIEEVGKLQEKKNPLMQWLNVFQNYISNYNPKFFQTLSKEDLQRFEEIYEVFQQKVKENTTALEKAIAVNKGVIGWFHEDIKHSQNVKAYNQQGLMSNLLFTKKNDDEQDGVPTVLNTTA
ncbi:hypothetical protein [Rickettsiales endosymbiont of Stachyamoeba lipophora]|uniref:hypothetical protein n=1 Tax=Rickettsiales endosymbiont of Stachyamoeba lipophora TaxID=2486578 RepID=UPI000F64AB7E|nr:hypothetical protein [Rickettsiales endosymbiont of Stachyamoeba lipophora]AZL16190.1 hypothetical protein EF513_06570 [Rickettsiales endosymbiont of Stachyamoeba lipophora]